MQAESVPQNAMSDENLKSFGQMMGRISAVIPEDAAFMKTVVNSSEAKTVSNEDRKKALGKLSNQGQSILRTVKSKCQIQDAHKKSDNTVAVPYVGAVSSDSVSSFVGGNGCPFSSKNDASTDVKYTRVDSDNQKVVVEATLNRSSTSTMSTSEEVARMSGLISSTLRMNYSGTISLTKTSTQKNTNGHMTFMGVGRTVFKNGEQANIKVRGEASQVDDVINSQMSMEISTSNGVFRIVGIKIGPSQAFYLNGKKVTHDQLAQLIPGADIKF